MTIYPPLHHRHRRRHLSPTQTFHKSSPYALFLSMVVVAAATATSAATTSAASMSTSPTSPSAIVHAVGGSIGSALALLLFYPLERSRIELQSRVSSSPPSADVQDLDDGDHDCKFSSSSSASSALSPPNSDDVDAFAENHAAISEESTQHDAPRGRSRSISSNSEASWSMQSTTSPANADDIDEDEDDFNEYPLDHIMTTPTASTTTPTKVSRANVVSQREHQKPSSIIGSDGTAKSTKSKNSRSNNPANDQNSIIRCILELASRGDLYKGVAPIITTTFISQFIFFFMNAYIKRFIFHGSLGTTNKLFSSASSKAILSLTTACLAGIGNVLLTNPLWVTNMAIVNRKTETQNLVRELIGLIRARGWKHLWDGTGASILLVSNPIIQFFCYEQFKQLRLDHLVQKSKLQPTNLMGGAAPKVELRVVETFLLAALAKAIATVLTYPLQLTQTLLRLGDGVDDEDHCDASQSAAIVTKKQQLQKHPRYKGSYDCLYQLYRTKGITSWFTGMRAKMIQTVLTAAFTFLTYEQVLSAVQTVMRNELMISNHGSIPSRNHGNTSLKPEG